MNSLHTGATLILKVEYISGEEKVIGFARSLSYSVSQGQKLFHVVDTPFPVEISQGASASGVKGSLTIYLPKGSNPESMGLVPYRHTIDGTPYMTGSQYLNFKIYDRFTGTLVFACEFCKISSYSLTIAARSVTECQLQFDGMFVTPG